MNVLFTINEAYPLYKIGGLGDVAASLPETLVSAGIDVRIALPKHPEISTNWLEQARFPLTYDRRQLKVTVYTGFLPHTKVPVYLFQEDRYLSQHTDASDNHADKYTVFSLAVAQWLATKTPNWTPDLVHLNDWHTSLIPVFARHLYQLNRLKYLLTIHNLSYQGVTTTPVIEKSGLNPSACQIITWDQQNFDLNILMEGILHADHVTTVSPTYAKEILTGPYGENLNSILESKKARLTGILNGLDSTIFDPQTDHFLAHRYAVNTALQGKQVNKRTLFQALNIDPAPRWLLGFVGRVDPKQKGVDLMIHALKRPGFPPPDTAFVFLGTGAHILEQALHQNAQEKKFVRIITRFDEQLARRLYAASDLMLIPSLFEPCGLVQLIAMKYGSLPVARKTGGLKDTIEHHQTGFLFERYATSDMLQAVTAAIRFIEDEDQHLTMITRAMNQSFTWKQAAIQYRRLYHRLVNGKITSVDF